MQVVILAGGKGTRIQSIARDIPKALIPAAGKPFIEHQFDLLLRAGIRDIVLCAGHLGDQIAGHVGDGSRWGLRVKYSFEDPRALMGTGGALLNALDLLEDTFFVLYGDSYLPMDYRAMAAAFEQAGTPAIMSVYRNRGLFDKSNVRIANGRVVFYSKSARPDEVDCIDYGFTGYRKELLAEYRDAPLPLDLESILRRQVELDRLAAYEVTERFYEIGKPEGLAELEEYLKTRHTAGS
ncbi:MAG TPA: sugar phosphate nucleotidyltransferase [Kiritimatiellia bacterium]|nr:sugar phosphate nucleotidyltransferase [Kiritimatiellia bacterium]HPA78082.1 sugar phosphate nucleotidyltransferase [Kiritimatiellia bacterium]HQQ04325.1 sugar phosphate nucleotidyltransferase [Kiritimatiellia bacterium]